jgi:large subunit ribosomal protein L28e
VYSAEVQWAVVNKFNSFLFKRNGVTFSTESGNLTNKHSFRASGLVHSRIVRVDADASGKGVAFSVKRTRVGGNKVASAFCKPSVIKNASGPRSVAAKVEKSLNGSFYRMDLIAAAKRRAAAITRSQFRVKKN